jgi:hypothetical protein
MSAAHRTMRGSFTAPTSAPRSPSIPARDETAVCNLGSVVLENHLTAEGAIDLEKLRGTIRVAIRALDNVIDINFYPTEAARTANPGIVRSASG